MDSGTSLYEKLITQCKSNDVDVKVDALTKLQAQFEQGGVDIPDTDVLINVLKSSLRTSNLHLMNATLSALPAILPVLISRPCPAQSSSSSTFAASSSTSSVSPSSNLDVVTLRLALASFLPGGGVIDRLGEKEKAQIKARETLIILGGYAFRSSGTGSTLSSKSGKGQETPIAIFERFMKEGGLASKVWKVREQSILTLVHIRRAHHLFPIRPYLSLLVDCLEDTDPHVRDCARQSVVELFTGPGVTDAARADLKKEMTKKGVRKTIVDGVLSKLLGGPVGSNPQSHEGSENGDATTAKKEYVPPSLALQGKRPRVVSQNSSGMVKTTGQPSSLPRSASRAAMTSPPPPPTPSADSAEIRPVYIASSKDLENEFASMMKPFEGKETEHNWAAREQSIQRVRGMLKGDVHTRYPEPFFAALKEGFIQWSLKTLASLRTTVAVNTCLLYSELAIALGSQLDPHVDVLLTNLLKMASFTKKITAQQSQTVVATIITGTSAQPRVVIPLLWNTLQEKVVQARAYVVGHLKVYLEVHGHRSKNAIEASNTLDTLEKALKRALADANPAAREQARILFWVFEDIWQDRGLAILETLDTTARKQLEKACPNPKAQSILPPSTPQVSKKSSVAAAIAASRAKAKAIATAPPTLRHQATSASYAGAPRRAGSPITPPKFSTTARPSSPQRVVTSPPSPPSRRVASTSLTRSTSAASVPTTAHVRMPSGGSDKAERSASPSLSDQGTKRRVSSPLANSTTSLTLRKALSTALPPSPPSSQASPTPRAPHTTARNGAVPLPPRPSLSHILIHDNDSLLMAQTVPIPDDTDSEDDQSVNLMSFSAPFEIYPPTNPGPKSPTTLSPVSDSRLTASVSNALSSGSISDMAASQQPVVEDALRARAEQAESAAERLLELVEPEDEGPIRNPALPPSLMKTANGHGQATPKAKTKQTPLPTTRPKIVPVTPKNRASTIMKQAAMFVDSPAQNGRSSSLLDVLQTKTQETGWWLKRKALFAQVAPITMNVSPERIQELDDLIASLDRGDADIAALKRLTLICMENTVAELSTPPLSPDSNHPSSPTPLALSRSMPVLHSDIWEKNKTFDRFFKALIKYLEQDRAEEELAYGLIVAWEVLESQSIYLEGKEGDLFSMILRVRYCNKINVLEGTNAIRDALTSQVDPVYGLTTMHASLKVFQSEAPPTPEGADVKAATYAFGLMALGKFILRLPAEIAEEELPRLKTTLITSLNDKSSLIVRESAAAAIIAAQLVLRDETHLFALLDGLADEKKNLLTYLFDKHGARETGGPNGHNGIDKLEKEIRRLDTRTSTPLRGGI
ncbi:clasp N terminal-domain-containing protein [Flammula alnicola]|nr:clasp N terminal-domain-containing protein [Flammula alnicola]